MRNIYIFTAIMGFRFLFYPVQLAYLLIVSIRKCLFMCGIRKRHTFPFPVICIGNIATGGTGKTPHTKYIAELLLNNDTQPAIILRGYKRKTKGFIHCLPEHSVFDIGDEAYEYVHGLNHAIRVFVCANRAKGIKKIMELFPETQVILMDDGYQHWGVKAGKYILLTDYLHPFYNDHVLPVGNLREPRGASKRADVIVVTKSPKVFSPLIERDVVEKLRSKTTQPVFFSYLEYGSPTPVLNNQNTELPKSIYTAFLITGIANPYPLEEHLRRNCIELYSHTFPDHHAFTVKEIDQFVEDYNNHMVKNKAIFTTEKDVSRLLIQEIQEKLIDLPVYSIPVKTGIHPNKNADFDKIILDYVRENTKNS